MEKLPAEVLECILKYMKYRKKDRLSLASCSKTLYGILKPILWQSVGIPLSSLSNKLDPFVKNLKYTTHLAIRDDLSFDLDSKCEVGVEETMFGRRKPVNIGLNVARLVTQCIPEKVVSLDTYLNGVATEYVLEAFPWVKTLNLTINGKVDGKKINELRELVELFVFSESTVKSSTVNDDLFWSRISGAKLRRLDIEFHDYLSSGCLLPISKWMGLESLDISDTAINQVRTQLNVQPLTALTCLKSLSLTNVSLRTTDLRQLCLSLKGLRKLDLEYSEFVNDALSEVHCLESLHHLNLNECVGISPPCFTHLISSNIGIITISADICHVAGEKVLDSDVAVLNKLSSLREVRVISIRSRSGRDGSAVIANSLCHDATWKMKLETKEGKAYLWTTFKR